MEFKNVVFFLLASCTAINRAMEQTKEELEGFYEISAGLNPGWSYNEDIPLIMKETLESINPEDLSKKRGLNVSSSECKEHMSAIEMHQTFNYEPEVVDNPDDCILWIIIHGTWGENTDAFFKETDLYYEGIRSCAQSFAQAKKKRLNLMSYRWSGKNNNQARRTAAWCLSNFLKKIDPQRRSEVVLIGHSHGCNVANCLTHFVDSDCPIDLLIYLSCPRRTEWECQPLSYKCLLYFLSDGDYVAGPASVSYTKLKKNNVKTAFSLGLMAAPILAEGFTRENAVAEQAANFIGKCGAAFTGLYLDESQKLFEAPQEFKPYDGFITVGIRVENKSYRVGHSEIEAVFLYLKEIIAQLHTHYPNYYGASSIFHLDIDGNDPEPIILAVIEPGSTRPPDDPKTYLTFMKIVDDDTAFSRELERQYDREARIRYMQRNGKEIPAFSRRL
jgi:hypothetical protein